MSISGNIMKDTVRLLRQQYYAQFSRRRPEDAWTEAYQERWQSLLEGLFLPPFFDRMPEVAKVLEQQRALTADHQVINPVLSSFLDHLEDVDNSLRLVHAVMASEQVLCGLIDGLSRSCSEMGKPPILWLGTKLEEIRTILQNERTSIVALLDVGVRTARETVVVAVTGGRSPDKTYNV